MFVYKKLGHHLKRTSKTVSCGYGNNVASEEIDGTTAFPIVMAKCIQMTLHRHLEVVQYIYL